jgi:hypothetical protein
MRNRQLRWAGSVAMTAILVACSSSQTPPQSRRAFVSPGGDARKVLVYRY